MAEFLVLNELHTAWQDANNQRSQQSASARRISGKRGGQLQLYVQHSAPFIKGNISVADCMPLSSLLKTIKINGGV